MHACKLCVLHSGYHLVLPAGAILDIGSRGMEHLSQNCTLKRFPNQLCCAYSSTDMKPVEITLF